MSIELLNSADPSAMNGSVLYTGFLADPSRGVPAFLPGVNGGDAYWQGIIERSRRSFDALDPGSLQELTDSLVEYNRRLGADGTILDKLGRASSGDVFFVVTGQQPGILGGALMVAYKIVTAVVLARHLERRFSIDCVPLYWCGSDDADFQEIRTFDGVTPELAPVSVTLPAGAHTGTQPVGAIDKEWNAKTWESVSPLFEAYSSHSFVDALLTQAFVPAMDHGEAAAALMLSLFGGEIAVVDGRSDFIKRSAHGLFLDYFDREETVKSIVRERGIALRSAGYHAQLETGSDSGIFLLEQGSRRKVPSESRPLLEDALRNRIESCTPGVILRTLVQDRLFRPLAAILGPAEIAYRAQIYELYELFSISTPAPVPRLSATYVPPVVADELLRVSLASGQFLNTPQALTDLLSGETIPQAIRDSGVALVERFAGEIDKYLQQVTPILPGSVFKKYRTKIAESQRRLERALGQLDEAGRLAAAERWPWIHHIESLIRPHNRPQERSLSLLLPFLIAGKDAVKGLDELGTNFIDDLLDGKPMHYVYSLRS